MVALRDETLGGSEAISQTFVALYSCSSPVAPDSSSRTVMSVTSGSVIVHERTHIHRCMYMCTYLAQLYSFTFVILYLSSVLRWMVQETRTNLTDTLELQHQIVDPDLRP